MKTHLLLIVLLVSSLLSFSQAQWMYTDLTEPKLRMASAALGTKAYFAGGDNIDLDLSLVEIYDVEDETWSYAELSLARSLLSGISCGSKVIFAGGTNVIDTCYTAVDIYDAMTDEWTTANLAAPRFLISAVAYGNKVLFAGGLNLGSMNPSNVVDIYDVVTGDWDTAYLSEARFSMGEAVVGDVAFFAGGDMLSAFSNNVDLYNFTTDTWSTEEMIMERAYTAAAAAGNKVMIVGGMYDPMNPNSASNLVETYDLATGEWTFGEFPNPRAFIEPAVTMGENIYFVGGGNFYSSAPGWSSCSDLIDIYNIETGEWLVDQLTHPLINHTVTTLETPQARYLFVAGGATLGVEMYSTVEILKESTVGVEESAVGSQWSAVSTYPNPFHSSIEFRVSGIEYQRVSLKIFNAQGQEVAVLLDEALPAGEHTLQWDAEGLPAGIYFYRLTAPGPRPTASGQRQTVSGKIVKF